MLILFFHLCPGLLNGLFPSGFLAKYLREVIHKLRSTTYAINSLTSKCKILHEILHAFYVLILEVFATAMQLA
jgi:hypothetical protein